MATYSLNIPCSIGVTEPIEFVKNKLWIAPLNDSTSPIASDFTSKNVDFLFKDIQNYEEIETLVTDWFKFFGSLIPMPMNFSYLALNRHIYKDCFENSSGLTIENHLENRESPKDEEIPFYKIMDGKLLVPFNRHIDYNKLKVVDLYQKYHNLSVEDELKSNFEFLSVSKNLMAHGSYFHDNVYYKTAHYYFLFESIINRGIRMNKKVKRKCNNCGKEIDLNPNLTDKVKHFFSDRNYDDVDIDFIVKLIKAYGEDRSKIVHWGKKETRLAASDKLMEKVGKNTITLHDEIKYGGVSVSSDIYFSELCQMLIIEELDSK